MDLLTRRNQLWWFFKDESGEEVKIASGEELLLADKRYGIVATNVSSTLTISNMSRIDARQYLCYRGEKDTTYVVFSRSHPASVSHLLEVWGEILTTQSPHSLCSLRPDQLGLGRGQPEAGGGGGGGGDGVRVPGERIPSPCPLLAERFSLSDCWYVPIILITPHHTSSQTVTCLSESSPRHHS